MGKRKRCRSPRFYERIAQRSNPIIQTLTRIPLKLPGKVYRSVMPCSGNYDPHCEVYPAYKAHDITTVVVLAPEEEIAQKSTTPNLLTRYTADGFSVIHFPIPDYGVPELPALEEVVDKVYQQALDEENIVIHCHAGQGRTGLFAACLARKALDLAGDEAIDWIRRHIPGAVEPGQDQIVRDFRP